MPDLRGTLAGQNAQTPMAQPDYAAVLSQAMQSMMHPTLSPDDMAQMNNMISQAGPGAAPMPVPPTPSPLGQSLALLAAHFGANALHQPQIVGQAQGAINDAQDYAHKVEFANGQQQAESARQMQLKRLEIMNSLLDHKLVAAAKVGDIATQIETFKEQQRNDTMRTKLIQQGETQRSSAQIAGSMARTKQEGIEARATQADRYQREADLFSRFGTAPGMHAPASGAKSATGSILKDADFQKNLTGATAEYNNLPSKLLLLPEDQRPQHIADTVGAVRQAVLARKASDTPRTYAARLARYKLIHPQMFPESQAEMRELARETFNAAAPDTTRK